MNLKTKFLDVLGRVTTPRCLNFILISCMGPRNSPKDTHVIFQPTLVHWSMWLQFKFGLWTLNVQKLNQCIKRPNEPGIIPKFSTILLFGLICLCKKLRREKEVYVCRFAHGGDMFPLGTTSLLEGSSGLQEAYTKTCSKTAQFFTTACQCHEMTPCQVS